MLHHANIFAYFCNVYKRNSCHPCLVFEKIHIFKMVSALCLCSRCHLPTHVHFAFATISERRLWQPLDPILRDHQTSWRSWSSFFIPRRVASGLYRHHHRRSASDQHPSSESFWNFWISLLPSLQLHLQWEIHSCAKRLFFAFLDFPQHCHALLKLNSLWSKWCRMMLLYDVSCHCSMCKIFQFVPAIIYRSGIYSKWGLTSPQKAFQYLPVASPEARVARASPFHWLSLAMRPTA